MLITVLNDSDFDAVEAVISSKNKLYFFAAINKTIADSIVRAAHEGRSVPVVTCLLVLAPLPHAGPIISSSIVKTLGFQALLYLTATVCFVYSPVMFVLKNPPGRQENQSLLLRSGSSDVRYMSYANEDDSSEHKQQR